MTLNNVRKYVAGAGSVAVLATLWIAASLIRPPASKAITGVEMPAWVFPPIAAAAGQNFMVCANNLTGDGSVRVLIGLLDVADSSRFLPGTTPMSMTLDANKGSCSLLLPAVQVTTGALVPAVRSGIPAVFYQTGGSTNAAGGGGGAGRGLLASVQLVGPNGTVTMVTPTLMPNLLLPAVSLP
jgi:hypothetical protein